MQPYRSSSIEPVKLKTPIDLGPLKRIGQTVILTIPLVIITAVSGFSPVAIPSCILYFVFAGCSVFIRFVMLDMLEGGRFNETKTISMIKAMWFPVHLVYIFGRWIVKGY